MRDEDDYFVFLYLAPNSQQPNTPSTAETVLDHVGDVLFQKCHREGGSAQQIVSELIKLIQV